MSATKILPSSQIPLINKAPKCKCICIRPPGWNIPPITNLYPVEAGSKPLPLTSIQLKGEIANSTASISYTQVFKNALTSPIECIYKFPSDYTFAVVGLTVKIADKTIEAEIEEKKKAEQKYDDAIAAGHTAVKLNYDEKLPDIIELNIGQLQPEDTAEITVRIVCELDVIKHGFFSFIFPLEFFPRYGDTEGVIGESGKYMTAEFSADFTIKSTSIITNLDVSNKGTVCEQSEDGQEVRIQLMPSKDVIAKDFVISYSTEQIRKPQLAITKCDRFPGELVAHISYIPRASDEHDVDQDEESKDENTNPTEIDDHDDPEVANGEFIFILDRSGSMGGERIVSALKALELFIRSIPPKSKFNVVSFGSSYLPLYPNSIIFNNENMNDALNKIKSFGADFGGTELYAPIEYVLSQPHNNECPKNVFVLTDGDISDTQRVLDKIKEFSYHTRVHSFGIGSGASIYLVKEIAKEGKGSSTLIADNDPQLKAKVVRTLRLASKPAFTNITVNWNENNKNVKFYVPHESISPNIYEEEPFHYYAVLSDTDIFSGNVELSFYSTFEGKSETICLSFDAKSIENSVNGQEFQIAAKHYISNLKSVDKVNKNDEILSVSVKYSVLSDKTAFFGKIKNKTKSSEEMKTIEIPIKSLQPNIPSPLFMPMSFASFGSPAPAMMRCCPPPPQCMSAPMAMPQMRIPQMISCPPPPCPPCFPPCPPAQNSQLNSISSLQAQTLIGGACIDSAGDELEDNEDVLAEDCCDYECCLKEESSSIRDEEANNELIQDSIKNDGKPSDQQIIESQDSTGFFSKLPFAFSHLSSTPTPQTISEIVVDSEECRLVWTTILCICILRKHFKSTQAEWSLIVKKAETYLKSMNIKSFKDEIKSAMSLV